MNSGKELKIQIDYLSGSWLLVGPCFYRAPLTNH